MQPHMSKRIRARVVSMSRASVAEDGSLIEMELTAKGGQVLVLQFQPDDLDNFVGRASQLFTHARNQMSAKGGHLETRAVGVADAAVTTAVGGSKVILVLRAENELQYQFALDVEVATWLTEELRRAAGLASDQSSQPRH
jgi:hypothetical protein